MNFAKNTFAGLAGPEIELFQKLLKDKTGFGVEIGCLDGFSTVVILDSSQLHLTSIDPLIPDSMEASLIGNEARLLENLAPYRDRHTFIKSYSHNVALSWDQALDFLFIDGDHNYEAVYRDISQWRGFIKPEGILAIHDSRMGRPGGANFHPGPSQATAELIYGRHNVWEIIGEAFSLTVAKKL